MQEDRRTGGLRAYLPEMIREFEATAHVDTILGLRSGVQQGVWAKIKVQLMFGIPYVCERCLLLKPFYAFIWHLFGIATGLKLEKAFTSRSPSEMSQRGDSVRVDRDWLVCTDPVW